MRDNDPLISIIVPVYNTEQYLEKCVNSIRNQSYSNLEIILVDDGSADHCDRICDHFAEIDSRITVIHQENGGQSRARNTGIGRAKGELFLFVDSDDDIDENMVEQMYKRIQRDQSDLAVCGHLFLDELGNELGTFTMQDSVQTGFQMLEKAYEGTQNDYLLNSIIWNKLYKRILFEQIRFPEGKLQEDEATVYKLLDQCHFVSILSEPLYCYVRHSNSTMTSKYSVKRLDGVEACYERYFFFRKKGGDYLRFLKPEGDVFTSVFFQSKQLYKPNTKEEKRRVREIDRMAREICFDNFRVWSFPRKIKLLVPELYIWLGSVKKRVYSKKEILKAAKDYLKADSIQIQNPDIDDEKTYLVLDYTNSGTGIMTEMLTCLGWLRLAVRNNWILVVKISTLFSCYDESNRTRWEDYFNQPMLDEPLTEEHLRAILQTKRYARCQVGRTRYNLLFYGKIIEKIATLFPPKILFPDARDYVNKKQLHREFCSLYEQYIHITPSVQKYIEKEYQEILSNKGVVLGAIVRGTDYVQLKPYRHPVQPSAEQVIQEAIEIREEHPWDYLYLATEEKKIEDQFKAAFPGKILINKRCYYDGDYTNSYLFEVKNDRENDQYLRNLEYFSSMYILSKCDMLIGGMCGGSQGVLIMRGDNPYDYLHLFELGNYGE